MLKQWIPEICPETEELKSRLEAAEKKLEMLQLKIKEKSCLYSFWLKAGVPPEKEAPSARLSAISIPVFLRSHPFLHLPKMKNGSLFYTAILRKYRKPANLCFLIPAGQTTL